MAKIMVVDDSLIIRMNLKKILVEAGHEIVAEAANGMDAVQKYTAVQPELVTMDITMPIMDGLAALVEIKKQHPGAKVIMISAMGQSNKVLDALNGGAKNFITKPFEAEKVLSAVRTALNMA